MNPLRHAFRNASLATSFVFALAACSGSTVGGGDTGDVPISDGDGASHAGDTMSGMDVGDGLADGSHDVANDIDAPEPDCSASALLCGGLCVDPQTDSSNCGGCGHVCASGMMCSAASCVITCGAGLTGCGTTCVNEQTDVNNCGACGRVCPSGQMCAAGLCTLTCGTGTTACAGACVNVQTDSTNCGTCGNACTATGQSCMAGVCTCAAGGAVCGGACVDEQTDSSNCGACGNACTVTGESCVAGACACAGGGSACGTACVDEQTDSANCGACAHACTVAGQSCMASVCACATGSSVCGTACVNEQTDPNNCGTCARVCAAGQVCSAGVCTASCGTGLTSCSGSCVNLLTNASDCGMCGHVCATGGTCTAGGCACPTGDMVCGTACVNEQTDLNNCGACGTRCTVTGETCTGGACVCPTGQTACGTACVNEQTDPNNCGTCGHVCAGGVTCSAGTCGAVCGNGTREGTEQCDDHNVLNLDGCDASCRFEQGHRITALAIEHGTSMFCGHNALGGAVSTLALPTLNGDLTTAVQGATLNLLIAFINPVVDLTGLNDAALTLGFVGGTLTHPFTGGATGANDLDWWYTADPTGLSATRVPTATLSGSITTHVLNAGPGSISLPINLGGPTTSTLQLTHTNIQATLGAANVPTESTTGNPPGHTTSENLNPAITSFATGGGTPTAPAGQLCGDVTALSLSQIAVPAALAMGGSDACSENYSASLPTNSLLDVFVHGCTVFLRIITPTQPDQPAGYVFTVTGNHVTGCTMGGATMPLATCLAAASYSAYLEFSTDRVIIH